jgi:uncharacterized membrane protein
MLIPRFSLRWMLIAITGFALLFLTAKFAVQGQLWAVAVIGTIAASAAGFAIFAALFAVAFLLSLMTRFNRTVKPESPFATDKLPPQVIPPQHRDS